MTSIGTIKLPRLKKRTAQKIDELETLEHTSRNETSITLLVEKIAFYKYKNAGLDQENRSDINLIGKSRLS